MVERFNSTLLASLTTKVSEHQKDWDTYIPYVLFSYRASIHASTGESPFMLTYGREPKFPSDIKLNTKLDENYDDLDIIKKIREIHSGVPKIRSSTTKI